MRMRFAWLTLAVVLLLGRPFEARSQPLGANPSAAPSEIGNPSSINPAARASDIGNPAAITPSAAATQQLPSTLPSTAPGRLPELSRRPRLRTAPVQEEVERKDDRKRRSTSKEP